MEKYRRGELLWDFSKRRLSRRSMEELEGIW
jgi:hypothetical protein